MLKLTPQQVTDLVQLTDQTLRHWRRVLPPLAGLNGYLPCFTPGDALALLVLRYLTKSMGISVSALAPASIELFDICRTTSWPHLSDRCLIIKIEDGSVNIASYMPELIKPAILVPMQPFADQLQGAWASNFPPFDQIPLQFPAPVVSRSSQRTGT